MYTPLCNTPGSLGSTLSANSLIFLQQTRDLTLRGTQIIKNLVSGEARVCGPQSDCCTGPKVNSGIAGKGSYPCPEHPGPAEGSLEETRLEPTAALHCARSWRALCRQRSARTEHPRGQLVPTLREAGSCCDQAALTICTHPPAPGPAQSPALCIETKSPADSSPC